MNSPIACRQAVVLCGGLGTRLGLLTSHTPKPLLPVGGVPFLQRLLLEIRRYGIRRVVLLASYLSESVRDFAAGFDGSPLSDLVIDIVVEPERAGTGGALWHARDRLDEHFFLFNGDSWFDINLRDLAARAAGKPRTIGRLALRSVPDGSRYGAVRLEGETVAAFGGPARRVPALVNGGVYLFGREVLDWLAPASSLEHDALPRLAAAGRLAGAEYSGFFIDIGVPASFAEAQTEVPARQRRPAILLDRDVLFAEKTDARGGKHLDWRAGAVSMVRLFNDADVLVLVLMKRHPAGKEGYGPVDALGLPESADDALRADGAHVDDVRRCPWEDDGFGSSLGSRADGPTRTDIIQDLLVAWSADRARSFLIGVTESDLTCARRVGLHGVRLGPGSDLKDVTRAVLASVERRRVAGHRDRSRAAPPSSRSAVAR